MESVNDKWRRLRDEKIKEDRLVDLTKRKDIMEYELKMSGVYLREIRNWLRLIGIMVLLILCRLILLVC
jgi:hypothetical protein